MKDKLDGLRIERTEEPQTKPSRWVLLAFTVLAFLALGLWWFARPGAAEVQTAIAREVKTGSQQTVLNASGYVTARRQATVSSKVTGKVMEVLIEEGMKVEEGQILARLDGANAGAAVNLSAAQLRAARSDLQETRVRREEARLDLERVERLVANDIASQAELDRARAEVDSLSARLDSQAQAVNVAERSLALAQQALDDTVIRAPFAGVVVAKNAQPGEMISPMSSGGFTRTGIGTVVDMSSLEIEVDVNEAYINRVRSGQRVEATLDAYPDWQIPSNVIAIIPTADRQKATVQVRIGFDQLDDRILPDMGVKVAFQDDTQQAASATSAVAIPRTALASDGDADIVYVVDSDQVERRAVRVGSTIDKEALVLSGVSAGERVVLNAPADLADGDAVKAVEGSN